MRTFRGCSKLIRLIDPESNMPQIETLPASGIYTLVISLSKELNLSIGKLGVTKFLKGYYTYAGSAIGKKNSSLRNRVSRHLRKEKRKHWHIDYFLADQNTKIIAVVAAQTKRRLECAINYHLKKKVDGRILVQGFGASDCKENCGSHLLYYPKIIEGQDLLQEVIACTHLLSNKTWLWTPTDL